MYAYLFGELTKIGIDVAGESQLVGFPTQFPSVSMVDWNDGKPNARFWVLKLLHDNFGAGDKLVEVEEAPRRTTLTSTPLPSQRMTGNGESCWSTSGTGRLTSQ